jgi:hypothetical protein
VPSQVLRIREERPSPARWLFTAQLGEPDKEPDKMQCEKCTVERARLPWKLRGGAQAPKPKQLPTSVHCSRLFKEMGEKGGERARKPSNGVFPTSKLLAF